jgi:UDP-N-acetylglucosamine--N-acetylmuramyl-(pentapeptide) pyrophosphoryl-undecaprenol N-acetylglucosamine transferase
MKILICAGASGGHIFPALSFLEELKEKERSTDALLVLPRRSKKTVTLPEGCSVKYISVTPIRQAIDFKNLAAVINLLKGTLESVILLAEYKPDAVVGFGGIESLPAMFFAWFFRIKTLLHEQNVIPGRANRVLAKFVDRVAISFPESKGYFRICPDRITLTGNPIRKEMRVIDKEEARKFFGLEKDKFTVLVMGGSQGSQHVNAGALRAFAAFDGTQNLQVIHLAGTKESRLIENRYGSLSITARVFSFLSSMEFAYSAADLAIARAGATTITELIFFKLPAILAPYPYAYQHQLSNAKVLERKGCALIVKDEELDGDVLRQALKSVITNAAMLNTMRAQFSNFGQNNAARSLVEEVEGLK